jgi:hypothetical protein
MQYLIEPEPISPFSTRLAVKVFLTGSVSKKKLTYLFLAITESAKQLDVSIFVIFVVDNCLYIILTYDV